MRVLETFEPLVTDRLVLRRSRPEDAETISAYRSDPEVHRYQGWERTDVDAVRGEIEAMADRRPGEPGGWVQLTVVERETERLVGDVGFSPVDGEPGVIKIGYTIAPAFQGCGYATESVRALVAYLFDTVEAQTVRAHASAENTPSLRVAEKAGMRLVERFRRSSGGQTWQGVRYEARRGDLYLGGPRPEGPGVSLADMAEERSYIEPNDRERERLRALVERLGEEELRSPVNEHWTVAGVLGHIAFWDARVLALADKLERAGGFTADDDEPEDVDWINDATRPLIHAIPPADVARLALQIAEEADARVATLPVDRMWPSDPKSPINSLRATHRGEHLDDIESALNAPGQGSP